MDFTDDMIALYVGGGFGLHYGLGGNLFLGPNAIMPPTGTGPFVSLIFNGGLTPAGTHNSIDVPAYEKPGMQVVVRHTIYKAGIDFALDLFRFTWPIRDRFINGTWYVRLSVRGSRPYDLPTDGRFARSAFNVDSEKRTSPATS